MMRKKRAEKKVLGLVGFPLGHSFSKKYFTQKFEKEGYGDFSYELFELPSLEQLPQIIQDQPNLIGFNVTIPYKTAILKMLDSIDPEAAVIGAVNTVKIENGKLQGFNTDVFGFEKSLQNFLNQNNPRIKNGLILGTGGASKAVQFVFKKKQIHFTLVSRTTRENSILYKDLNPSHFAGELIIVNTTPLGMQPLENLCPPIPFELLGERHLMFDLIYNPEKTVFLQRGKERGCPTQNGWDMLCFQAEKSWEIWKN